MYMYMHVDTHGRLTCMACGLAHLRNYWNHREISVTLCVCDLIQVPAGLFIPSMFVGACMGRVVGICVEQLV